MKIVVRMPNWLGDAVLAAPALAAVRARFPDAEVWLASRPALADLFPTGDLPRGVVLVDEAGGRRGLRASVDALRAGRFDAALLLTNSFASALAARLAGIPRRWGAARDGRGLLLTRRARVRAPYAVRHQRDDYLALLGALGIPAADLTLSLRVTAEEAARADALLREAGLRPGAPLVVLGFGASYGPAKRWPAERFAALAALARREAGADVALIGAAGERADAARLAAMMEAPPVDLTGRTTLRELAGVLARAALFVTNDTGPMHLAAALGTPVVAIFGPTDPEHTRPLSERSAVLKTSAVCWPCLYRECPYDHRCLAAIPAEEAWAAGRRLIG